jgi:hypothetical protein
MVVPTAVAVAVASVVVKVAMTEHLATQGTPMAYLATLVTKAMV